LGASQLATGGAPILGGRRQPSFRWHEPDDARVSSPDLCCVKKTRKRHAVREMKADPSEPSCRGRLQTAMSCFGRKGTVVNVMVKRRELDHVRYG
jgi:hypothetical protein